MLHKEAMGMKKKDIEISIKLLNTSFCSIRMG
jgi:hypothetical protein